MNKKLQTEDLAPSFLARDIHGNQFSLDELKGKKVFLSLLRTAACPFCNLHVHHMIQKHEQWKSKGIITVAVFSSPAEKILQYAGKQQPPFTILADPEENIYQQYGIGHSRMGMFKAMLRMKTMVTIMLKGFFNLNSLTDKAILSGDFLIDEDGKIVQSYYGKDFGDNLPLETVDNWG